MDRWLAAALDYIPRWIEFQMAASQQPGCIIAIAHRGHVVLERAFGAANLETGEALTPRHRFRVASHSKSFTAAGIMKLREQRRLKLDDAAGHYVEGLHRDVAHATIAQLLSHTAGIIRDGEDAGQFLDRRPYLDEAELRAELKLPLIIAPGTRMKYSNHGFGLLGLIIKAITGEPYATWIKREIVDAAGLKETQPDMPLRRGTPFARGHTGRILLGRRLVIPGDNPCNAIDAAGGFVSTAADIARYGDALRQEATAQAEAAMNKINLAEKLSTFSEHWSPRTVTTYNGHDVMVVKVQGEFVWHKHDDTDDFFLVLKGTLDIELRDRTVTLNPGEMFIVPKGIEHRPVARDEVHLLLIEPTGTPNTGDPKTAAERKLV